MKQEEHRGQQQKRVLRTLWGKRQVRKVLVFVMHTSNEYVLEKLFQQNHVTDKTDNTSFSSVLAALRTDNINKQNLEGMVLDGQIREISSPSIEEVLKQKCPQLSYHVCDDSKFTYGNRLDFPFSEVFKERID